MNTRNDAGSLFLAWYSTMIEVIRQLLLIDTCHFLHAGKRHKAGIVFEETRNVESPFKLIITLDLLRPSVLRQIFLDQADCLLSISLYFLNSITACVDTFTIVLIRIEHILRRSYNHYYLLHDSVVL